MHGFFTLCILPALFKTPAVGDPPDTPPRRQLILRRLLGLCTAPPAREAGSWNQPAPRSLLGGPGRCRPLSPSPQLHVKHQARVTRWCVMWGGHCTEVGQHHRRFSCPGSCSVVLIGSHRDGGLGTLASCVFPLSELRVCGQQARSPPGPRLPWWVALCLAPCPAASPHFLCTVWGSPLLVLSP